MGIASGYYDLSEGGEGRYSSHECKPLKSGHCPGRFIRGGRGEGCCVSSGRCISGEKVTDQVAGEGSIEGGVQQ